MQGWNIKDVAGGLVIGGFGLAFLIGSFQYEFGEISRIGPGVFPMLVGLVAVVLGAMIVKSAYGKPERLPRVPIRALVAVLAAILGFAGSIQWLGVIPAVAIAVPVASLGDRTVRPLSTIMLTTILALGIWLIFSVALGLPIQAFKRPF